MPYIGVHTSVTPPDTAIGTMIERMADVVTDITGKARSHMMTSLSRAVAMQLGDDDAPCAYVDLRGIGGLNPEINQRLSDAIGALLEETLGVAPDHVYITFTSVDATHWGWNRTTFGA